MTDSIDIEELLIWTYQRQLADVILSHGIDLWPAERDVEGIERRGHSGDGIYDFLRRGRLGVRVDVSPGCGFVDVPADAIAVHRGVMGLGQAYTPLIIQHARTGTRPPWYPDARFRYEPHWKNGPRHDPKTGWPVRRSYEIVQVWRSGRQRRFVTTYCPVRPIDHPSEVHQFRRSYRLWHGGLTAVGNYLSNSGLTSYEVISFGAPAQPWIESD